MDEKTLRVVNGFLERAWNKRNEAKEQLDKYNHSESISASQECIEFAIKSMFLLLQDSYPRRHEFEEEEFERLLERVPQELQFSNFPRLFLFHQFWTHFYTVAKYGYDKLAVPAKELFKKEEAELALKHAEECYYVAVHLRSVVS